jgi:glycosyltransferase involved in cell wall biosynthesis
VSVESISIIMPTYNSALTIGHAIESALAQTLSPAEIIIVDDGSVDDTQTHLARYAANRTIIYVHQRNRGVSAARNTGLQRATGQLIAFLDADDVWHPAKLALQVRALEANPDLGMLGTETFCWPGPVPTPDLDAPTLREITWSDLVVKNHFTTSSILVRRAVLESVGPTFFDTELHGPEDYDLWLRIAETWKAAVLGVSLTGYRSSPLGLGNQAKTMETGMGRILEKLEGKGAWDRPGRRLLRRKAHAYYYFSCALMYGASGSHATALMRVLRSMTSYPMPFSRREVKAGFARPKLFGVNALRLVGLKASASRSSTEVSRSPV